MVQVERIDPRDAIGELDPVFRAHLWRTTERGVEAETLVLNDCDVVEALAWLRDAVPESGRGQLFVATEVEDGVELVRLFDTDPKEGPPEGSGIALGWG